MASPFAAKRSKKRIFGLYARGRSRGGFLRSTRQQIAQEERDVGGAFGQAAHEIRKPIHAERDVDADAVSVAHEFLLQVGADAVEHLEFEAVTLDVFLADEIERGANHGWVVRRDAVINAAGQQNSHQLHVVGVHIGFLRKRQFGRLLVGALAKAQAATDGEQVLHVLLGAVEIRLHYGANARVLRAHAFYNFDGSLRVGRTFHIHAHEIRLAGGVRDDFFQQLLTEIFAQVQSQLRELQRNVCVQMFLRDAIENRDVFVSGSARAPLVLKNFSQEDQGGPLPGAGSLP